MRKSNFFEDLFFSIRDFECKFYALWQNKLSDVAQTLCTCPDFSLAEVFFYRSFWKFLPFLYFKQNVPSIWWKPGRVVNSAFYMWWTSFWGKNEKSAVNYFSRTYREKMSKNLWQTLQNCICLVLRNTLRKFVSLKIYFFLSGNLSVTFLPSGKQIQLASQNFILRVQKNNFLVKNTSKCTIFSFLVLTAKKSLRKFFGRLVEIVLVLSTLIYWGKPIFSKICFIRWLWV